MAVCAAMICKDHVRVDNVYTFWTQTLKYK